MGRMYPGLVWGPEKGDFGVSKLASSSIMKRAFLRKK
jgi:hypothetical protein